MNDYKFICVPKALIEKRKISDDQIISYNKAEILYDSYYEKTEHDYSNFVIYNIDEIENSNILEIINNYMEEWK